MAHFKERSSRVLRELSLILGSQVKENLLKRIKNFYFFGILTVEVTDIANIQNLVTFIKFYDEEKVKAETAFIDSTDLLHFSFFYYTCVAAQLWENQDLTHMLNVHCICHRLALIHADSA